MVGGGAGDVTSVWSLPVYPTVPYRYGTLYSSQRRGREEMHWITALSVLLTLSLVQGKDGDEWKSRIIYQVRTCRSSFISIDQVRMRSCVALPPHVFDARYQWLRVMYMDVLKNLSKCTPLLDSIIITNKLLRTPFVAVERSNPFSPPLLQ